MANAVVVPLVARVAPMHVHGRRCGGVLGGHASRRCISRRFVECSLVVCAWLCAVLAAKFARELIECFLSAALACREGIPGPWFSKSATEPCLDYANAPR